MSKLDTHGAASPQESVPRRPSRARRLWSKIGFKPPMLLVMFKGSLPPTIAIAFYQATPVANEYSTIGYLVAVVSFLSFCIMPRAKFLQTMTFDVLAICIGSTITLLEFFCCVKARQNTTKSTAVTANGPAAAANIAIEYNSSSSAVAGVWLFLTVYLANVFRASHPQLKFPCILYSIMACVSSTYAPTFASMTQAEAFLRSLILAFLTGFGIASAVSLFVFPNTSRKLVFRTTAAYLLAFGKSFKAQTEYLRSLEDESIYPNAEPTPQAVALKASLQGLEAMHNKLMADIEFAKREVAWGKLGPSEIQEMFRLLRGILLPTLGMGSIVDLFERVATIRGWRNSPTPHVSRPETPSDDKEHKDAPKDASIIEWTSLMHTLHVQFSETTLVMEQGLKHVAYTLRLDKPTKSIQTAESDIESRGNSIDPGDPAFAEYMMKKCHDIRAKQEISLRQWCEQQGVNSMDNHTGNSLPNAPDAEVRFGSKAWNGLRKQRQLYVILYMEFLLHTTADAVLELVRWADKNGANGNLKQTHLIVPGARRMRKWVKSSFKGRDIDTSSNDGNEMEPESMIHLGESYTTSKDPEHLPPTNIWQKFTNWLRAIPHFLGSPASIVGFRAALGVMSIGVINFLRQTQQFFLLQRLFWAMIMVCIGMNTTAGGSIMGFIFRITGSILGMVASYLIWWIVVGHTAGAIVLFWLFTFLEIFIIVRFPKYTMIGMLTVITSILVIGYELQLAKVGVKQAASSGQQVLPQYILAPYRVVCVIAGLSVAFVFMFFPTPITSRAVVRKDVGTSLYLLASYYTCVHNTLKGRVLGYEGSMESKDSPGRKLEKFRLKLFSREMALLAGLTEHVAWTAWEPTFGGRFPKEIYDNILREVRSILKSMALITIASRTFSCSTSSPWNRDLQILMPHMDRGSREVSSILVVLSASVINGQPLPPYLQAPAPYQLSQKLESLDKDILSINHVAEPGYSAFAVTQVATRLISADLESLISHVKELVGQVDFSWQVLPSQVSSNDSLDQQNGTKGAKKD